MFTYQRPLLFWRFKCISVSEFDIYIYCFSWLPCIGILYTVCSRYPPHIGIPIDEKYIVVCFTYYLPLNIIFCDVVPWGTHSLWGVGLISIGHISSSIYQFMIFSWSVSPTDNSLKRSCSKKAPHRLSRIFLSITYHERC